MDRNSGVRGRLAYRTYSGWELGLTYTHFRSSTTASAERPENGLLWATRSHPARYDGDTFDDGRYRDTTSMTGVGLRWRLELGSPPVCHCPCGRYYHLESPGTNDDQGLSCYLAGPCGLGRRQSTLEPVLWPEPPTKLLELVSEDDLPGRPGNIAATAWSGPRSPT
jgi:hypothetical protein